MSSHVEHEHDPFIKQASHVNPNMTRSHLVLTHDLFINGLVVSSLLIMSNFLTPTCTISTLVKLSWLGPLPHPT